MKTTNLAVNIYRSFFQESIIPSLIVVPSEDLILDFNHAAMELYGYEDEREFSNVKCSALSDDRNLFNESGKTDQPVSCCHRRKSGENIDVLVHAAPYEANGKTLLMLTVQAVDHHLSPQKAISNVELLQILIDIIPSPIYCKNSNAQYILCNTAFEHFFNKKKSEIIGRTSEDILSPEYSKKYHAQDLAFLTSHMTYNKHPQGDIISNDALHFKPSTDTIEYAACISPPSGTGHTVIIRKTIFSDDRGRVGLIGVLTDISELKEQEKELRVVYTALEGAAEAIIAMDVNGNATYLNNAFTKIFGYEIDQLKDANALKLLFGKILTGQNVEAIENAQYWQRIELEGVITANDGREIPVFLRLIPIMEELNHYSGILALVTDITEKIKENEHKNIVEMQLLQAHKLEAIGQLAAGIAHELNTPIQFVGDNINFLDDMFKDLLALSEICSDVINRSAESEIVSKEDILTIKGKLEDVDIKYLSREIPSAFEQSHDGVKRIADIVRAMKDFSHPGTGTRKAIDVNKAVANTVTIARNEWKYVSEVKLDLAPNLPMPPCYEGEFKQVVLNILINAAHAIGDALKQKNSTEKGIIKISTHSDDYWVYIDIADTGTGIPDAIRDKIFDPFFTTKEPGRGTGQGLAISHDVIVNKHQGRIFFDSEVGKGSTCHLWLPMRPPEKKEIL